MAAFEPVSLNHFIVYAMVVKGMPNSRPISRTPLDFAMPIIWPRMSIGNSGPRGILKS